MTIKNIASHCVTLIYSVGRVFDFEIYDSKGNKLGAWSELTVTKRLIRSRAVEVKPGETLEQTMKWDQKFRTTALIEGAFGLVGVFVGQVAQVAELGYLILSWQCSRRAPLMFTVTSSQTSLTARSSGNRKFYSVV